jgi:AraC-like DNA-binding protein
MSVSEIAWACGFSTPNYFIRSFKHNSGLTPARFREAAC